MPPSKQRTVASIGIVVAVLSVAARAFAGWLLMVPPQGDTAPPVETWKQEEAFDTARACEDGRREELANVTRLFQAEEDVDAKQPLPPALKEQHEKFRKVVEQIQRSRCVPADHVYPPARAPEGKP